VQLQAEHGRLFRWRKCITIRRSQQLLRFSVRLHSAPELDHFELILLVMWAIVFIGYAMAAVARQFLLYDPIYVWPYSLMQTAVFENLRKSASDSKVARKQKIVFFGVFLFAIAWHFLPEYIFTMLSSLAFLCWVAPHNPVANFIGSGIGGMGFLNLSLDWGTISTLNLTNPMIAPFWTTAVLTAAFIFNSWILIPAAKWGNLAPVCIRSLNDAWVSPRSAVRKQY
jgi:hypothetical protein